MLIIVAIINSSCILLYESHLAGIDAVTLMVSICDVLASIVAGAFIVVQLRSDSEAEIERAKTEEARFILEYNMSFIENKELCDIEHYLEDAITHAGTGKIQSLSESRQSLVNYLVYLEGFASCVNQKLLQFEDIDNLFSYRFFLAMNHPEVQALEIIPYADFYRGSYQLFDKWYQYRMKNREKNYIDDVDNCNDVMPLAKYSLFKNLKFEKYLDPSINMCISHNEKGERQYYIKYGNKLIMDISNAEYPADIKKRMEYVLKKNKDIYDNYIGEQLHSDSIISKEQYERISELIYDTDPYIYPAMFGENGKETAIQLLPTVFENNQDAMFNKENLYIFKECKSDDIVGIILWVRGILDWDVKRFLTIAKNQNIDLPEENVWKVSNQYVDVRYDTQLEKETISLINICISAEYRSLGLGRLMLNEFMHQHTGEAMELCVLEDNESAVRLYSNCGFVRKRTSDGFSLTEMKPVCLEMKKS